MRQKSVRSIQSVVAVLLLSTVLFSSLHCSKKEGTPIKIGLVTTLTGPASTAGILTRNGALLAIEEANASGGINGRQVMAIIRDDKGDPEEALRIDKELIKDGVVAFLGHYLSSVSVHIVPLMNDHNMLLLSLGAATGDLYGIDDSFVRICLSNNIRSRLAARQTYQRLGIRSAAVVYDISNAAYTVSAFDLYKDEFEQQGGKIIKAIPFDSREAFNAPDIADEIIDSGVQGLYIITDALHGALICQHLRKNNTSISIMAGAWASTVPEFIGYGGRAVEGVYSIIESNNTSKNPKYLALKKVYEEKFGHDLTLHAQNAYDITGILLKTLEKQADPGKLKQEIISQQAFQGVDGIIRIDRNGEPVRPVYLMQIQDGRMQVIETLSSNDLDK